MRRRGKRVLALATLASLPALCWAPPAGRRVALLIGNNRYQKVVTLDNAAHDAEDLAAVLKKLSFAVTLQLDADLAATSKSLTAFTAGLHEGDVALLFYAGHGIQIEGENYIVPTDFAATTETEAKQAAYPASKAQRMMEHSGAMLNLLVLDACRNNPLRGKRDLIVNGLAIMDTGLGTYIALSTGPGQTASDNTGERNGLFTKHLLAAIQEPGKSLDSIFSRVKVEVVKESQGRQRPWLHSDVTGDFFFQGGSARAPQDPTPPPAQDATTKGQTAYQAGDYAEAVRQFNLALRVHPEDPYLYNALGAAYVQMKQVSLAFSLFGKAIEKKPDYAAAYYNRGVAYLNAAQYELADQDFSWSIEQDPNDPLALDRRGQARFALLNYDGALEDFSQAAALNPADAHAFLGRGKVEYRRGKYAEALADLDRALRLQPRLAEAAEYRANVVKQQRR